MYTIPNDFIRYLADYYEYECTHDDLNRPFDEDLIKMAIDAYNETNQNKNLIDIK